MACPIGVAHRLGYSSAGVVAQWGDWSEAEGGPGKRASRGAFRARHIQDRSVHVNFLAATEFTAVRLVGADGRWFVVTTEIG